jgi:hypothetical protein
VVNDNGARAVSVSAKYVIVATAPLASAPSSLGGTISYTPPLKPEATQLFSSMIATPTVSYNILVVYKEPWWRKVGEGVFILPPYATHVNEKGVWGNVVEGTMNGEGMPGIVRVFCDSSRVEGWTEQAIKDSTIAFLKKMYPKYPNLVDTFEEIIIHDWNLAKPTIPGVTYTYGPSGVLSKFGKYFTEPHGRIHWGGSERSVWGANWMEGAVERGNDVSEEVLKTAGWVQQGYNVRKSAGSLRVQSLAAPSGLMVEASDEGDEVEAEQADQDPRLVASPESPIGLAQSLQPRSGPKLAIDDLYNRLEGATAPEETQFWVSPQQCLDALKELEEAKKLKKAQAALPARPLPRLLLPPPPRRLVLFCSATTSPPGVPRPLPSRLASSERR